MNKSEIKKMMIDSLSSESENSTIAGKLGEEGVVYDFGENFSDKLIDRLFTSGLKVRQQAEFMEYMSFAFYRIALPGIAAIVLLLISIFIVQGSLSINSLLGLSDNYDESIVYLLTGN